MYSVVVDIDNVLNNLTEQTIKVYNSDSGKNVRMKDIATYNFSECLPQEDADSICKLFLKKELWDSLTPIKDSKWGLETLVKTNHRVILATATHEDNFKWKVDWIKRQYPFIDTNNIVRIKDKGLLQCDFIVDDCLEQLISNHGERIVFDYPWNRDDRSEFIYDIHRATNWKQIINIITNLERGYTND